MQQRIKKMENRGWQNLGSAYRNQLAWVDSGEVPPPISINDTDL